MNSHCSVDQCRCVGVPRLRRSILRFSRLDFRLLENVDRRLDRLRLDLLRRPSLYVACLSLSHSIDRFLQFHQPILFHFDAFISGENSSLVRSALDLLEFVRQRTSCLRRDLVFPSVLLARLFSSSAVSLRTIVDRLFLLLTSPSVHLVVPIDLFVDHWTSNSTNEPSDDKDDRQETRRKFDLGKTTLMNTLLRNVRTNQWDNSSVQERHSIPHEFAASSSFLLSSA